MRQIAAVCVSLALLTASVVAKGPTTRIVIKDLDRGNVSEITDRSVLDKFQVWSGKGLTQVRRIKQPKEHEGFIIDWQAGVVDQRRASCVDTRSASTSPGRRREGSLGGCARRGTRLRRSLRERSFDRAGLRVSSWPCRRTLSPERADHPSRCRRSLAARKPGVAIGDDQFAGGSLSEWRVYERSSRFPRHSRARSRVCDRIPGASVWPGRRHRGQGHFNRRSTDQLPRRNHVPGGRPSTPGSSDDAVRGPRPRRCGARRVRAPWRGLRDPRRTVQGAGQRIRNGGASHRRERRGAGTSHFAKTF